MLSDKIIEVINDRIELAAMNIVDGNVIGKGFAEEDNTEWDPFNLIMANVMSPVSYAIDFTLLADIKARSYLNACVPGIKKILEDEEPNLPEIECIIRKAISKVMGMKAHNELLTAYQNQDDYLIKNNEREVFTNA